METLVVKYRLKAGSEGDLAAWRSYTAAHRDEILERCREEGIALETAFVDRVAGETFLFYFLKAPSLAKVYEIFDASVHPVDVFQKDFKKKVIDAKWELEVVADFQLLGP